MDNNKISSVDIRDSFFDALYNIAEKDKNIIFLTADMGALSLEKFKKNLKKQFINVGVAEQNMVSIAAGMSLSGKKVFIYAIASFVTMRCYEQIKVDISGMCLPISIIGAGPGISYSIDGHTHHATQDISIMRALPEMVILNPSDSNMSKVSALLAYHSDKPVYIRIDKGNLPILYSENYNFLDGLALLKKGSDLIIITSGITVHYAFNIANELSNKLSLDVGIIDIYRLKPINVELLLSFINQTKKIITLEEHSIIGGLGTIVSEILVENEIHKSLKKFAIADVYSKKYGHKEWMYNFYGLDIQTICSKIQTWV